MWLITAVAAAAFAGNLGAELIAEGVADFTTAAYWDWFWSFDASETMAEAARQHDQIQAMITEAERQMYQAAPVVR